MIERRIVTGTMTEVVAREEYRKRFGKEPQNDAEMYESLQEDDKRKEILKMLVN
ncbi:hypothetical protein H9649_12060 [Sporosarcina sp. Sa2YVA2]|uniref:Uncharacterized protein n=1 Tax=Sporosarcina quadrami TaxID=2762234 RepID=A0ABR8UC66_9BACL|nr:hypothetical protein [Sporosarcina quadrami]MBD7985324.1 hypothetical protein [Sporosarcina quadrami]